MKEFTVTTETFDGPLDLMLHLIREKKLDLLNLDMNILTDQYIAYLESMEYRQLEIASEYLVELAGLIEYKSRRLLPGYKEEEGEEEDPKERLVRRLLEYQQFKEVSSDFRRLYEDRQMLLGKPLSQEAEQWMNSTDDMKYSGTPYELMKAMRKCLMRMRLSRPLETKYAVSELSMEDREVEIRARLDSLPDTFTFETLLEDVKDLPKFIVTFLSVLDLARLHVLYFSVDESDTIWLKRGTRYE